jgi:hypothetical protein
MGGHRRARSVGTRNIRRIKSARASKIEVIVIGSALASATATPC